MEGSSILARVFAESNSLERARRSGDRARGFFSATRAAFSALARASPDKIRRSSMKNASTRSFRAQSRLIDSSSTGVIEPH